MIYNYFLIIYNNTIYFYEFCGQNKYRFTFRLNIVVYYDDAFYGKFGPRCFTRIAAIIALVSEQYSETSFKTRLEITMRSVKHVKGHNWGILIWNQKYTYRFVVVEYL